jgi:crossover junction endodeoxyribonuclease RuvC
MIILGLDPGLGCSGWGAIAAEGNRLSHVANGQVRTDPKAGLAQRLLELSERLGAVLAEHDPAAAAVEEVFVNENPQSTLKLGQARGVVLLAAAARGIAVGEYAPRLVKKAVVGTGGADKSQVRAMVQRLLPGARIAGPDAADALAVAITHAHHLASRRALGSHAA